IVIEAASGHDLHALRRIVTSNDSQPPDRFLIVDDFMATAVPIVGPQGFQELVLSAGFRSLLTVQADAGVPGIGLGFWSKEPKAFAPRDVPIARRVADHVAVAVSHEQLARAAKSVAEVQARAERLETRARSISSDISPQAGPKRVVGHSPEWLDMLKQAIQVAATETTGLLTPDSRTRNTANDPPIPPDSPPPHR